MTSIRFPREFFRRMDESDDADFYAEARLVTHIDDATIARLTQAYREYVPGSGFVFGTVTPPEKGYDYTKDPQPPGYASDHYPVVIDITPRDLP